MGTAVYGEATRPVGLGELQDGGGTAIVIHAAEDENDPEGKGFGARILCGVPAAPAS